MPTPDSPWSLTLAASAELLAQSAEAFGPNQRQRRFRDIAMAEVAIGKALLHEWVRAARADFETNPDEWPVPGAKKTTPPKPPSFQEVRSWLGILGFEVWLYEDMPEAMPLSEREKVIVDRMWAEKIAAGIAAGDVQFSAKEWRSLRTAEMRAKEGDAPGTSGQDLAAFANAANGKKWREAGATAEPEET